MTENAQKSITHTQEDKLGPSLHSSLGGQVFFDDNPVQENDSTLGSKIFFNNVPDYSNFEEQVLYNELNGEQSLDMGLFEPEPTPGTPPHSAMKLTKKRKSQAWDSKPLENRRKSMNWNAKALDSRRKTMYEGRTKQRQISFNKTLIEESSAFENNQFYSSGFNNPNYRPVERTNDLRMEAPESQDMLLGASGLEIEEHPTYIFDEGFDNEPPLVELENLYLGSEGGPKMNKQPPMRRRKSEAWDSRPLELVEEQNSKEKQAQFFDDLEKAKKTDSYEHIKREENKSVNFDTNNYNGFHPGQAPQQLHRARTSFASPLNGNGHTQMYSQMSTEDSNSLGRGMGASQNTFRASAAFDFGEDEKQRRTKWTSEEVHTLWKGIMLHGNNWSIIKDSLPSRTYYQIKDKGRRILYNQGWKTGRTKKDAGGASDDAKVIAQGILHGR